jgi:ABC-type Fe3+-hydroxamate transport system substrate-binding protein
MRIIDLLGRIVNKTETADSIRAALEIELNTVEGLVRESPRTPVAILGGNPPLAAGAGTFLHELVELAGGSNVFADSRALYAPVSVEAILARRPDLLLVSAGTTLPSALDAFPWRAIPPEVEIPGLGLGVSARILANLIHPELFR